MRVDTKDLFKCELLIKNLGPHQVLYTVIRHKLPGPNEGVHIGSSNKLEINKDLRERENKENSRQEIRVSSGSGCFLSPMSKCHFY